MYRVCWYVRTLVPPVCMYVCAMYWDSGSGVHSHTCTHEPTNTNIHFMYTSTPNICCSYIRTHVCTYVRDLFKALFFSIKAILLCPEETTVRRYTSVSRTPQK